VEILDDEISSVIVDFASMIEAACFNLKQSISEHYGVIGEESFNNLLGWQLRHGSKIGDFEYTSMKANNNSDAFNHVYNFLKVNNATITRRFSGEGYIYVYWLYSQNPGVIFRKSLEKVTIRFEVGK